MGQTLEREIENEQPHADVEQRVGEIERRGLLGSSEESRESRGEPEDRRHAPPAVGRKGAPQRRAVDDAAQGAPTCPHGAKPNAQRQEMSSGKQQAQHGAGRGGRPNWSRATIQSHDARGNALANALHILSYRVTFKQARRLVHCPTSGGRLCPVQCLPLTAMRSRGCKPAMKTPCGASSTSTTPR